MLSALLITLLYVFCCFFNAAVAIGAFQMLEVVVHAALAIRVLQVLVVTSLCLFACCFCHRALQMLVVKCLC